MLYVVSVRDVAVESFSPPFTVVSLGLAIRMFGDECGKADSPMFAHPEDFSLYHVGSFDEVSGRLISLDNPTQISRGVEVRAGPA